MTALPAGRELDMRVSEGVMGREVTHPPTSSPGYYLEWTGVPEAAPPEGEARELPHYSTDIAAAWAVVEKVFRAHGYYLGPQNESYGWGVYEGDDWALVAEADTAPLAICRAALLVVQGLVGRQEEPTSPE